MARLYLPIKEPTTGRETILFIPGASHMDGTQLRDIIQAQTEKIQTEAKLKGPPAKARYSKKEIAGALREYRDHLERKAQGTGNPRYR